MIKSHIKANRLFYFRYIPYSAVISVFVLFMFAYPRVLSQGVTNGLDLCVEKVVPSLFPCILIAGLVSELGITDVLSKPFDKICKLLFALPGNAASIIIMSFLGGFPVGTMLAARAYEKGQVTLNQARRLLLFCVNPGPAFTISTVGCMMLGSREAGLLIYASIMVSSFICGVFSRFLFKADEYVDYKQKDENLIDFTSAFSYSVNAAGKSIVNICLWIIVFNCIISIFEFLPVTENIGLFINLFTEVTVAAEFAVSNYGLPLITFVVSFAGFCIHAQLLPYHIKLSLKYGYFFIFRVAVSLLSCIVNVLLIRIYPDYSEVFALGTKPVGASSEISPPVCAWLMLMCGLFMIGDRYVLKRKNKQ